MTARDDQGQLAARLVEAAAKAGEQAEYEFGTAGTVEPMAVLRSRRVTTAVLRELASTPDGYLRHQEDGGITYTKTLRGLADYIEKGAGDGQH